MLFDYQKDGTLLRRIVFDDNVIKETTRTHLLNNTINKRYISGFPYR